MDLQSKKRIFYFLALLASLTGISLLLWFFQVAHISVLDVNSFDYCDLILVHIILEIFITILAFFGFFFVPDPISAKFFGVVASLFLGARLVFVVLFYTSQENKLFNAQIRYFKGKSRAMPEKLSAFQAVYYYSGISIGLDTIFMVMGTFFAQKEERSNVRETESFYIEIR